MLKMLSKLLKYVRGYRVAAVLAPIMMLVEVATDVTTPFLMRLVVNEGVLQRDAAAVSHYGSLMILMALIGFLSGGTASYLGARAGQGFGANLRNAMFTKIQRFSFANLDHFGTATLITRLSTDAQRMAQTAEMTLRMAVRAPFMLILASVMALSINTELAVIFAVSVPILALALFSIVRFAFPKFSMLQDAVDRLNGVVNENLSAMRVVKGFVREDFERAKFEKKNSRVRDISIRIFNVIVFSMPMMFLMMYATMIAILWFGGVRIMDGQMLAGDLIGFLSYITQIFISLTMLTMLLVNYVRAKASAVRCLEVIETDIDLESPADGIKEVASGDISFENVSFRYAGMSEDSLKDINLTIEEGQKIGIIGSTGSSKTTLVMLLSRLYDPQQGVVRIGGVDVRDYDLKTLRDEVSVVLQKNRLFSGTVRENMQFGDETASDEEIWQALDIASAKYFIEEKDGGLDHEVEAEGGNFSGGQRQRLTIARALLKKPKILILDDAMSAVDMATERRLKQTLANALKDVTVLTIAQRISSVQDADLIIVMHEGRIDGLGDHETLLKTNRIYREVYESQQQGIAS